MKLYITILTSVLFISCFGLPCFAACPSMDFTGDCVVDFADFAIFAEQWLDRGSYELNVNSLGISGLSISSSTGHDGVTNYTQMLLPETSVTLTAPATVSGIMFIGWTGDVNSSNPTISFSMDADKTVAAKYAAEEPAGMVWVDINDTGVSGYEGFNGQMSKYETTNAQYCEFLNAALATGDITVSDNNVNGASGSNAGADFIGQIYYNLTGSGLTGYGATDGGAARINYVDGWFSVDSGFENHPVTYVSWYGATAFASYYGWRLPTEWEWQAVADYDGSYTYGCGAEITYNMANYGGLTYPNATVHPDGTTVVGAFGTYGYGMCDMAGNVVEWTSSIYSVTNGRRARGGCWLEVRDGCQVSYYHQWGPLDHADFNFGFRACR